jgi:5-histidylcysteine sulfoxide synthase/putative 4-mercaptohistidine N1-methyltranferase
MNPGATSSSPAAGRDFGCLAGPLVPTKTPLLSGADPEAKRAELRRYFHATCELYDRLFALIRDEASYYERHEPLRHPLIFYFGHPAVFYVNKLIAGRLIPERIDPRLESMLAVGVDEMSWDDLDSAHYDWPAVRTVREYRHDVRALVDGFIRRMPLDLPIRPDAPAWVILMGIEHERIHLETSSVIMRQMPLAELRHGADLTAEERRLWRASPTRGTPPANEWLPVPPATVRLGKPAGDETYGWDNEYGVDDVALPAFRAARRLVSNAEFLGFIAAGGYRDDSLWTDEGRGWLHYTRAEHPKFWLRRDGGWLQRNLLEEIPLPLDWPVEVNCLEAQAYCAWLARETGEPVTLPTEAHWRALREGVPGDQPTWTVAPGNINLEHFASSCPVTAFPQGEFCDVVGNVWQWTRTPIMPYKGFEVHPLYDDFSVPTFDGRHNLMKGGSWISTGNEALKSARYAFRRHFFQHAGFRTIVEEAGSAAVTAGTRLYETDQLVTQYLEFHYFDAASGGFDAASGGFDAASGGFDAASGPLGVPNFPQACAAAVMPHVTETQRDRCLDIGCSVGRSALEFARYFAHVDAIDFSARFIQAGVRLQAGDEVHYEIPLEGELTSSRAIALDRIGLTDAAPRVAFLQGDACNLKSIFTDYDLVFAGNLIDRLYDPGLFLAGITTRIRPGGLLAITSPYTWLEEYTAKAKWLGGRREAGEPLTSFAGLERALAGGFTLVHRADIPFVIRETARKYQHSVAELTIWRRS